MSACTARDVSVQGLPPLLPAWQQISCPAFFIRICLSLWQCLRPELWLSLTVDTGTVSAAFTLGWGYDGGLAPGLGELVHLGRAEPCQGGFPTRAVLFRLAFQLVLCSSGCSSVMLCQCQSWESLEDLSCELVSPVALSCRKVLLQLELSWAVTLGNVRHGWDKGWRSRWVCRN